MLLICDDEKNIRRSLAMVLEGESYDVCVAANAGEALRLLENNECDAVLLDVQLPDLNGLEVLRQIKALPDSPEVIMISGHANLSDAVEATRLGAFDFLEKPINRDRLLITVRNALDRGNLKKRVRDLVDRDGKIPLIGDSPVMLTLAQQIEKVGATKARVLISGESGTGKELVAWAIHQVSPRADCPFVKVNCAAIPAELIESELFGHEKGSFTGALRSRKGRFEAAHRGTLLLDEVGDMSPNAQAKVLRVLQTSEVTRVGNDDPLLVDVRVIAATNKNLEEEIAKGLFREDLYFRLNVVPIRTPELRKHPEDIPLMVEAFLESLAEDHGLPKKAVTEDALRSLMEYDWPGNVRELRNVVERLLIMAQDPVGVADLPDYVRTASAPPIRGMGVPPGSRQLREFREMAEREYIEATLLSNDWNVSRTAEQLGVERTNLHKKIKHFGIERDKA